MTLDNTKGALETAFASRGVAQQKEQWELEADAYDASGLGNYLIDEKRLHAFEGLRYCENRCQWVARFRSAHNDGSSDSLHESSHSVVLRASQIMHDNGIKPSQGFRALKAFGARLDVEVANLTRDAL